MEQKQKKEQKPHAHVSKRDSAVTGVKKSHQAHQSDKKSCQIQEKLGDWLRTRESRLVARTLAALVNPSGGGTMPRITVTTSVLHCWQ